MLVIRSANERVGIRDCLAKRSYSWSVLLSKGRREYELRTGMKRSLNSDLDDKVRRKKGKTGKDLDMRESHMIAHVTKIRCRTLEWKIEIR